jgi:hypothetical protein
VNTAFDNDKAESISEDQYAARRPRTVAHLEHQHVYVRQDRYTLACDCGAVIGQADA